ncbi:FG-GAP-like repeat-containing protein [Micromonospora sp. NPDC049559]|uniref:Ig-like domain-containing protein n=1 Tax=Micromonospora sp. NPDC049559 TaxID=3155923 RepID=UPI0034362E6A
MWGKRTAAGLVLAITATVGGVGVFAPVARAGAPGEAIWGDVNGDGFIDRVFLGNVQPSSCAVIVEYGRPDGVLLPPTAYTYLRPGGTGPDIPCPDLGVAVDLTDDGIQELVIAWSVGPPPTLSYNLRVLDNNFQPAFGLTESIFAPQYMGIADFNGDGRPDVYAVSDEEGFATYLSLGDGTLTIGPKAWCSGPLDYLLYDWNRDGAVAALLSYTDACTDHANGVVHVTGNGSLQFLQHDPTGTRTWQSKVAFVNGDSWADIRTVSDTGEVEYFIQPPGGGTFVKSPTANHDRVVVSDDRAVTIPVLANDYVTTSARLTIVEPPRYGTVQVTSSRTVVYRPNPDHRASDRFVYRVTEGTRSSNAAVNIRFTG